MPDLPSPEAILATAGAKPAPPPDIETLIDRERRNPWLRWLVHLGAPIGVSIFAHLALLTLLGITGWVVMEKNKVDVGEYEAGITDSLADKMAAGFKWPGEEEIKTPEPEDQLDKLSDLSDLSKLDAVDLKPAEGLGDNDSGMGLGESGRGDILGIGAGAGGAGSGGFGSGLGSGRRAGNSAGMWGEKLLANKISYVIDYSGSVIVAQEDLVRELKKSVGGLKPPQAFNVFIFFSTGTERGAKTVTESFGQALQTAKPEVKKSFFDWIAQKSPQGSTEPLEAMRRALKMEPEAIFFLSDGYFDESVVDEIKKLNKSKTKIICLVFDEILLQQNTPGLPPRFTDGAKRLQRIARENNGTCKVVTGSDLEGK